MIPILINHDATVEPIGHVTAAHGEIIVTMNDGNELTVAQVFAMFGCMGFDILEWMQPPGFFPLVKKFRIREWSMQWT